VMIVGGTIMCKWVVTCCGYCLCGDWTNKRCEIGKG
jgi:hypothetical protein